MAPLFLLLLGLLDSKPKDQKFAGLAAPSTPLPAFRRGEALTAMDRGAKQP